MLSRLAFKLRKAKLGAERRHQAHIPPGLTLRRQASAHEVLWRGKHVAMVADYRNERARHSGVCLIVGAGPSLRDVDVRTFAAFDAIALNGAIVKYTQSGLAPRHHIMMDHKAFETHLDYAHAGLESGALCYYPYLGVASLFLDDAAHLGRTNLRLIESIDKKYDQPRLNPTAFYEQHHRLPGVYMSPEHPDRRGTIGFNAQGEAGFFTSNTVAVPAVQLALYLGYRTILLMGLELGYDGHTHFNDAQQGRNELMASYDPDIKVCFELGNKACEDLGAEIYNLTPQSLLSADIAPRLSLQDALERWGDQRTTPREAQA